MTRSMLLTRAATLSMAELPPRAMCGCTLWTASPARTIRPWCQFSMTHSSSDTTEGTNPALPHLAEDDRLVDRLVGDQPRKLFRVLVRVVLSLGPAERLLVAEDDEEEDAGGCEVASESETLVVGDGKVPVTELGNGRRGENQGLPVRLEG